VATIDDLPDSLRPAYDAMTAEEQAAVLERLARFPGLREQIRQQERIDAAGANLSGAVVTLRQWATDAQAVTVTAGNAVQTLQIVVGRLGIFFDRFADLLVAEHRAEP